MIIKEDNYVLTIRGLLPISDVVVGDEVYDGTSFVNVFCAAREDTQLFRFSDVRGKYVEANDVSIETRDDKIGNIKVDISNIKVETKTISHLSKVFKQINNKTTLSFTPQKEYGNRIVNINKPTTIDEKLSYFLGYSYGDGYAGPDSLELACSDDHPKIKQKLLDYSYDLFCYRPSISRGDGKMDKLRYGSLHLMHYLEENGIKKQHAGSLILPNVVMNSNIENMMSFYSGYFDADGYASGRKKGYSIASIDLNVLRQFSLYLSLCGVSSKIHAEDRSHRGWNTLYTLCVVGSYSKERLIECANESVKITGLAQIGKRDTTSIPYTAKELGLVVSKYSFCAKQGRITLSTAKCFERIGIEIDTSRIVEEVMSCNIENGFGVRIETSSNKIWANGYILHQA